MLGALVASLSLGGLIPRTIKGQMSRLWGRVCVIVSGVERQTGWIRLASRRANIHGDLCLNSRLTSLMSSSAEIDQS